MKIAITSSGDTLNSTIDPRFGRCVFFAIYDTERGTTEFLTNPAKDASGGAGPAAVQFIAKYNIKKIYSGEFGGKIISLLDDLKIEMINEKDKTILDVIENI